MLDLNKASRMIQSPGSPSSSVTSSEGSTSDPGSPSSSLTTIDTTYFRSPSSTVSFESPPAFLGDGEINNLPEFEVSFLDGEINTLPEFEVSFGIRDVDTEDNAYNENVDIPIDIETVPVFDIAQFFCNYLS